MRAIIETFDNATGDATAARGRVYDAHGRVIASHETKYYREYPRAVRAASDAENALRTWARKRLMTFTIERR